MAWFVVTMKCRRCGTKWKRRTRNLESADPPCPNLDCGEVQAPIGIDLSLGTAPAMIGRNLHTKAIDETAKIVMEDQGLTDLRDDVRQGETMEPKVAPAAREAADAFFGGGAAGRSSMPVLGIPGMTLGQIKGGFQPNLAATLAVHGSLSDPVSTRRSIGPIEGKPRAPVSFTAVNRGDAA